MNNEMIISILSFVINSILLSGFIIPQVQKLKDIKDQLIKFKLTFVPKIGSIPTDIKELEENQEQENVLLQNNLDIYRIRSEELKVLITNFRISVELAIVSILLIVKWPNFNNPVLV